MKRNRLVRRLGVVLGTRIATGLAAATVVAILLAACGGPGPSGSPSPAASSTPTGSVGPSPLASPCAIVAEDGKLPSDRLVDVDLRTTASADLVIFRFGEPSGVISGSEGRLREVFPPFVEGASGLPVEVPGQRFVEIGFEGLFLYDGEGTPTYAGERRLEPGYPAVAVLVNVEEFEGYSTWILGLDGPGCVELDLSGGTLTVAIAH